MIKVTTSNNVTRNTVIVSENTTLRKVLEDAGINYNRGVTSIDGTSLRDDQLDMTFADFNISDRCYLMNAAKVDNAAL